MNERERERERGRERIFEGLRYVVWITVDKGKLRKYEILWKARLVNLRDKRKKVFLSQTWL